MVSLGVKYYLWGKPEGNGQKIQFQPAYFADKKNGLILLRLNYKARRFQISTGFSIPLKFWNAKTQRVKETQAFPHARQADKQTP